MAALTDFAFLPESIRSHALFPELLNQENIDNIDILFSYSALDNKSTSIHAFLFLVFFSAATRNGHSCLAFEEHHYEPYHKLFPFKVIKRGFEELPAEVKEHYLHIDLPLIFFKKIYELEKDIFQNVQTIIKAVPEPIGERFNLPNILTPEQTKVIQGVFKNSLSFIYGGPGTGKTFVLIQIIKKLLSENADSRILIASPTGKSTSNIKELLSKNGLVDHPNIAVQTLHSLLFNEEEERKCLMADLIIVDETSMISLDFFNLLLFLIPQNKRLVLAGDPNQLPPIGIGNIFADLINCFPENSYKLTVNHRTSSSVIINYAESILKGESIKTSPLPSLRKAIDLIADIFIQHKDTPTKFCVLTPLRKGPWGSEELNKYVREAILSKVDEDDLAIPIMIHENLKSLSLFNGDIGLLDSKKNIINIKGREISRRLIENKFSWNYVTSVHKSQGSEYEQVLLLLPEGSEIFSMELIYTGITRARNAIDIWSSLQIIDAMIKRKSRKQSGFSHKIYKK